MYINKAHLIAVIIKKHHRRSIPIMFRNQEKSITPNIIVFSIIVSKPSRKY